MVIADAIFDYIIGVKLLVFCHGQVNMCVRMSTFPLRLQELH